MPDDIDEQRVTTDVLALEANHDLVDSAVVDLPPDEVAERDPIYGRKPLARCLVLAYTALSGHPVGPHGAGLIDAIERTAGLEFSPGTVYPRLHDLDEEGICDREELVRTKHYYVADDAAADAELERYEDRLQWYLAVVRAAREALDTETADTDADTATDSSTDAADTTETDS
jgi:DNA-binding PadR family transcriptional regulator